MEPKNPHHILSVLSLIILIACICATAEAVETGNFDYGNDNPDFRISGSLEGTYTVTSGTIGYDTNSSCPSWETVIDRNGVDGGHLTVELDSCQVFEYTLYYRAQGGGTGHIADLEPDDVFIEWDEDPGHGSAGYFSFSGNYVQETPSYVQVTGTGSTNWTAYRVISAGELTKTEDCCNEHEAIHLQLGPPIVFVKVDDIIDCVGPDDYITYTIDYNYPAGPNLPDYNDVNIIDYLPDEVDFNDASIGGVYNSDSHTVTWEIGTLSPGTSGSVRLTVKVKPCVEPCITIRNECEMRGENIPIGRAYDDTSICCPMLTKVDDVNDGNCVGPGDEITYSICYAANGYPDSNVRITDSLPQSVEFISADSNGSYNPETHTVTWVIGTLDDDESSCVSLTVRVGRCLESCCEITNCCKMTGDCIQGITACENTPVCSLVVDDIEGYNPNSNWYEPNSIWNTWRDMLNGGTGSNVGYWNGPPYTELTTVHSGNQSMPYYYGDYFEWYGPKGNAYYSEAYADTADLPSGIGSDWTAEGVEALELWFYGDPDNDANAAESMYVALEDSDGPKVLVYHDSPYELLESSWHGWLVNLEDFNDGGVDLTDVQEIYIGFGDPGSTSASGKYGLVYFDDIRLCTSACSLSLSKTVSFGGNCVGPGDEIIYTIDYNNFSVVARTDVNIIDELPPELEFISADSNGAYDPCSHTVAWDIGTLGPDESGFVILTVEVKCPAPGGTITNCCEMTGDCITSPITACESTTVCGSPTLTKLEIVPDGNCVGPGDEIVYNICYATNGYGDTNVKITDELPIEVEFILADSNGAYDPYFHTVTWDIGTLGPDESGSVTLTVKVKCAEPGGTITNCCEMTGDCVTTAITACENTSVCGPPTLTKVDNLYDWEYAWPDGNITYSICYSANGYGDTNVEISDDLPLEVNYVSSDPCGAYNEVSHKVTWDIPVLGPDDSDCLKLKVRVKSSIELGTTIINECWMTGDCIDINAIDNTLICSIPAGSYPNEVMADEPVLWLRFEEDDPCDWSGNNYWVEAHPAVRIEETIGSIGKAAYLNGGYVAAANQKTEPNLPTEYGHQYAFAPNEITFEFWLSTPWPDALYVYTELFSQSDSNEGLYAPEATMCDAISGEQKCRMAFGDDRTYPPEWGSFAYTSEGAWAIDTNWHHYVFIWDPLDNPDQNQINVKCYRDGINYKDDTYGLPDRPDVPVLGYIGPEMDHLLIGGLGSRDTWDESIIGCDCYGCWYKNYWQYIDEFAIYPKVLSPCRIAAHYAAGKPAVGHPKNCKEIWERGLEGEYGDAATVDLNHDCNVDFYDFAIFAEQWALCNDPGGGEGCVPNW